MKQIRIEMFRPRSEPQLPVGDTVPIMDGKMLGIILARFAPAKKPDEVGYVVESTTKNTVVDLST